MLNMIVADIYFFMNPGFLKGLITNSAKQIQVTEPFLLIAAVVIEIPIAMAPLDWVLTDRVNRWVTIIADGITIAFIIGGGSTTLHYLFFATIEILSIVLIMWLVWAYPRHERELNRAA